MGLRYLTCAVLALCLWIADAHAEVTIQASVDRRQVEVDDVVQVTISVVAERLTGLPAPEIPMPDGFQLAGSTSSTSTSISIVNGAMTTTRTTTYVFSYRARREGVFELGPARLTHGGKTFASQPVRVEVVASSGQPQTRVAPGQAADPVEVQELEENLFLQAQPDKRVVYVGEQVGITYTLYTRYNLQNVHYGHVPTFTGFWAETLFDAQRLEMRREVVDGREFNAARLKHLALFPTTAGTHTLEQLAVICEIPAPSRSRGLFDFDPFSAFDALRSRQVTVRSGDVAVEVRPLPPGAPAGFQGAVGRFDIRAEAALVEVKAGDPVAVKVVVWGTGNMRSVAEPTRPDVPSFRFYDPKSEVETHKQNDRLSGQKTFEYVVIPQKAGLLTLPPFRLVYFDPDRKRYETAETAPVALRVAPGEPVPASIVSRDEVRELGQDIRYIKPDREQLAHQGALLYARGGFWALHLIPLLGVVGAYFYRRHQERLLGDVAYARRRRARSEARKRLGEANRLRASGDAATFHAEIHRALAQFLADRLNCSAAGLTSEQAVVALAQRGIAEETARQVRSIFAQCDQARFAPVQATRTQMDHLYALAESLIDDLDRRI